MAVRLDRVRSRVIAALNSFSLLKPLRAGRERLRRLRDSGRLRRLGDRGRAGAWKFEIIRRRLLGVRVRTLSGAPKDDEIIVIVCFWSRPHRLRPVIDALALQENSPPIRLVVWNNQPKNDDTYRAEIARSGAHGAISRIEFGGSRYNLGGMARFLVARTLTHADEPRPFIMIDDDQDVSPRFISDSLTLAGACVYAGVWAFRLGVGYWDRADLAPGEAANYVGTGGSICDSRLVHERGFFSGLPGRYGFVEDLWASSFAFTHGWAMHKTPAELSFVDDEVNQYPKLVWVKAEFFEYLRDHRGYTTRAGARRDD